MYIIFVGQKQTCTTIKVRNKVVTLNEMFESNYSPSILHDILANISFSFLTELKILHFMRSSTKFIGLT